MYTNEYKQQVYKKWLDNGSPWFDIDPKKEPTYAERQVIIEMKKQENNAMSKPRVRPKPKNEVRAFHKLLTNAFDY